MRGCFVEVDLVQAEWVCTAYLAQDANMLAVVKQELDPHVRTGHLISGAPEELIREEAKVVGHTTDPNAIAEARASIPGLLDKGYFLPRVMSIRQAGKKSNHALNYDMRYKRFALENEMDEREARRIVDLYRNQAYPGLKRYYTQIQEELRRTGRKLTNCFGHTRQFLDRWGPDLLNAAYAYKPQSTVAVVTNRGWVAIYRDCGGCMERVLPAANTHDAVLTQHFFSSLEELEEQVRTVDRYMSTPCVYHDEEFVLRRTISLGVSWGEECMVEVREVSPSALESALEASVAEASRRFS